MSRNRGFTLVELMIVVVILGILASVVIPQFSAASIDANSAAVMADLQTIRGQLQLYAAQHGGTYPTATNQLLEYTDAAGNVSATYAAPCIYGPYVLAIPNNPYTNSTAVDIETTAWTAPANMGAAGGWWFNSNTGQFLCNVPDALLTSAGVQVNGL